MNDSEKPERNPSNAVTKKKLYSVKDVCKKHKITRKTLFYYDRTEYTLNFQIEGYVYTENNGGGQNSERYGTNDGGQTYFRIYYRNGQWRMSDNNNGIVLHQ